MSFKKLFYQSGEEKIADLLIKSGANVNLEDDRGRTPLHWALREGNVKVTNKYNIK